MAAFENVPWIPSASQFLQSMLEGSQVGLRRGQLMQSASPARRGTLFPAIEGPSLRDQAMAEKLRADAALAQGEQVAKEQAFALNDDLIRRGASAQEAYDRSGIARFGVKPPESEASIPKPQIFNVGGGKLVEYNNGNVRVLSEATPKEPTITTSIYPEGIDPMVASLYGIPPIRISGSASQMKNYAPNAGQSDPLSLFTK